MLVREPCCKNLQQLTMTHGLLVSAGLRAAASVSRCLLRTPDEVYEQLLLRAVAAGCCGGVLFFVRLVLHIYSPCAPIVPPAVRSYCASLEAAAAAAVAGLTFSPTRGRHASNAAAAATAAAYLGWLPATDLNSCRWRSWRFPRGVQ